MLVSTYCVCDSLVYVCKSFGSPLIPTRISVVFAKVPPFFPRLEPRGRCGNKSISLICFSHSLWLSPSKHLHLLPLIQWFSNCGAGPPGGTQSCYRWGRDAKMQCKIWSEIKLNEYHLCREHKQKQFADAIMLTFTALKFNMDPFELVASQLFVNDK